MSNNPSSSSFACMHACRINGDFNGAEVEFIELLARYPQSMCAYNLTDNLQYLIVLCHVDDQLYVEDQMKRREEQRLDTKKEMSWITKKELDTVLPEKVGFGLSFEDLSLMFDRSKSTIHQAIRKREAEVRHILEEARFKASIRDEARQQLIDEEKEKLKLKNNSENGKDALV